MLVHGLGTVIGAEIRTKGRIKVYQGVTIGGSVNKVREIEQRQTGQPVIGDNVVVYTDAKLFGPIYIGNNNIIKAGKIVTEDLQDKETE